MVTISKKAEYACSALIGLASSGNGFVSSQQIAQEKSIPRNLISQLLAVMTKEGWVESVRGPKGGVRLYRDPESITLYDVIYLIDGPIGITRCLAEPSTCPQRETCRLRVVWRKAQSNMLSVLHNTTIHDMVEDSLRAQDQTEPSVEPPRNAASPD